MAGQTVMTRADHSIPDTRPRREWPLRLPRIGHGGPNEDYDIVTGEPEGESGPKGAYTELLCAGRLTPEGVLGTRVRRLDSRFRAAQAPFYLPHLRACGPIGVLPWITAKRVDSPWHLGGKDEVKNAYLRSGFDLCPPERRASVSRPALNDWVQAPARPETALSAKRSRPVP